MNSSGFGSWTPLLCGSVRKLLALGTLVEVPTSTVLTPLNARLMVGTQQLLILFP